MALDRSPLKRSGREGTWRIMANGASFCIHRKRRRPTGGRDVENPTRGGHRLGIGGKIELRLLRVPRISLRGDRTARAAAVGLALLRGWLLDRLAEPPDSHAGHAARPDGLYYLGRLWRA